MSDLIKGSHLITPRFGYDHHGLYIGHHRVIHLTSDNYIEEVSLSAFTTGKGYRIQKEDSAFSASEIVSRAKSYLGREDYSLLFNNCEHFVNKCIHDKPRSQQVNNAALSVSAGTSLAITQASAATATGLVTASSVASGITLLSTTPVLPAAIVGLGVFKLIQFLAD